MRCLVTGYSGFIGSCIIKDLQKLNYEIVFLGRNKPNIKGDYYYCDFRNLNYQEQAFKDVDVIIHCAGLAHDTDNDKYSLNDYEVINYRTTLNLAEIAFKHKIKKFIFFSSVKAAPFIAQSMNDEESQSTPLDAYGKSKLRAEKKLRDLQKHNMNTSIIIIRPALVYGEGMTGNLSKMYYFITKKLFPPLPKINNKRSMINVKTLSQFTISMIKSSQNFLCETFILTDDITYSTRAIYEHMYYRIHRKETKISLPLYFFWFAALIGNIINIFIPFPMNFKTYNKLFSDEFYSNKKSKIFFNYKNSLNFYDS